MMFLLSDGDSFLWEAAGFLPPARVCRKDDREAADAPEEHQKHHDAFGKRAKILGDADGKTDGPQRRSRLKSAVNQAYAVDEVEQHAAGGKKQQIHHEDGDGMTLGFGRKTAREAGRILLEAKGGDHDGEQGESRRRLDAARCGAGRAADEHQDDEGGASRLAEVFDVDRIVAGSAGRDGLKEGDQEVFARGNAGIKLEEKEEKRRNKDEDCRHREGDLALQAVGAKISAVQTYVRPGGEAEAAGDDEEHDRDVYDRIADEIHQGIAEEIEACIAEG